MNRGKIHFLISTLVVFCLGQSYAADAFWQKFTWTTADGTHLVGTYHPAGNPNAYTWILLHGLGSYSGEWNAFSRKLGGQGEGVLLYDLRGHAESIHGPNGTTISYKDWHQAGPGTPWDAMTSDVASAVSALRKREGLTEKKIAVGGASLGANVALVYASEHPSVPALVLLSPGISYAGIETPSAYSKYRGRPVFIAATPADQYAYASVQQLSTLGDPQTQQVVQGRNGHGVNMLDDDFTQALLDWMKKVEQR